MAKSLTIIVIIALMVGVKHGTAKSIMRQQCLRVTVVEVTKWLMTTEKEKAEAYVRSKCPELMELSFGCLVMMKPYKGDDAELINASISQPVPIVSMCDGVGGVERMQYVDLFGNISTDGLKKIDEDAYVQTKSRIKKIIGHPIQLQHWLRVLEIKIGVFTFEINGETGYARICQGLHFNLLTGQPATETDYAAFNQIAGNI